MKKLFFNRILSYNPFLTTSSGIQNQPTDPNIRRSSGAELALKGWCLALLLGAVSLFPARLLAQITVDGNPKDWPAVLKNPAYVPAYVRDANSSNDNQFTQGSADPNLISKQAWSLGQTNDKGDISNAGAAEIGSSLYFFGDRTAVNGDASIGFWFYRDKVAPLAGGSFGPGVHMVGDLLVLSDFTNGGGAVNLGIYTWVGTGGNAGGGTLKFVATTSNAAVNSQPWPVPTADYPAWTYTPKTGTGYVTGSFFEGTINLKDLGIDPCFSTFLLETRNSQSVTASLQDFANGDFNTKPVVTVNSAARCTNDPAVTLTASVTGGLAPLSYSWSNGATTSSITVTDAGTYTVTVSGANGCQAAPKSGTVTIKPAPTGTDATMSACSTTPAGTTAVFDLTSKNGTVTGGAAGVSVLGWYETYSAAAGFSNAISSPATYTSGSKTVYAQLSATNGCTGVAQNALTVNPTPAGTKATMSSCPTTVGGTTAVFDLTSQNSTVIGGAAGVSVAGWYETYSSGTFSAPIAAPTAYTSGSKTVYAKLSGTGSCTGVAQNALTVTPSPIRPNVTITEPSLCGTPTATVTVKASILNADYTLTTSAGVFVATKKGNGGDLAFGGLVAGSGFSITVTNGGCVSAATDCSNYLTPASLTATTSSSAMLAPSQQRSIQTEAYPNPTGSDATINFSVPKSGHTVVQVYNSLGSRVATLYDAEAQAGENYSVTLKGATLSSGTYYYKVTANGKTTSNRISLVK